MQHAGTGVPVGITQGLTLYLFVFPCMINHYVGLAVLSNRKAVVTGTKTLKSFVGGKYRLGRFVPGSRIQQVGIFIYPQQPETIIVVGGTGRIGDKYLSVALEHSGAFVDLVSNFFSFVFGFGNDHLGA